MNDCACRMVDASPPCFLGGSSRGFTWQATVLFAQILDNCSGLVELPGNEQGVLSMHRIETLQGEAESVGCLGLKDAHRHEYLWRTLRSKNRTIALSCTVHVQRQNRCWLKLGQGKQEQAASC